MRFPIVNVSKCPDRGLQALYDLNDKKFDIYAWLNVLVSLEQILMLSLIASRSYKQLTFFLKDTLTYCKVPTGLILLWSIFTSASVALVGLTMRGNISVFAKTIHVIIESLFLVVLFSSLNLRFFSNFVIILASFMSLWVISIPQCLESVTVAVSLGVILDFINFFSYLIIGLGQHYNKELWMFVHGLGWHVLYLGLFAAIHYWEAPTWFFASLRLLGATFNIIAVEIFILLLKTSLIDANLPSGWMKLSIWKSYQSSSVAWSNEGILSVSNDNLSSHNAQESAYTEGALYKFWFGYRNKIVTQGNKITQYLFIFPVKEFQLQLENKDPYVFVYDLSHPRFIRIFFICILSIVLPYL